MTEKLYYKDIYKIEFEANVVDLIQEKKAWKVLLNKTCFFPEGGGQPPDKGWINDIPVIDVQKDGDFIYHYLPEKPGEDKIRGKIDLEWRKDFMQQHTGQHIISGALWKIGNYKTVSVHMGMDYTTIEIDSPEIPEDDLINTEKLANQVIQSDMPIRFIQANHQEIDQFHLRKPCTRKGNIRLVKIGDFDCVACGGLHFDRTSNIGLVKAVGIEKIRGNVRMTWKIGDRAFEDYREKDKIITSLRSVLSTNEDMFVQKTRELQEEIINYKKKCNKFENRLAETIAQNLYTYSDRQNQERPICRIITESREGEYDSIMMKIMKNLLKQGSVLVCLVNIFSNKLQWCIGCSDGIHFPFDRIKDELLSVIDGKGGGRAPIWQGTGVKPGRADDFLSKFRALALDMNLY